MRCHLDRCTKELLLVILVVTAKARTKQEFENTTNIPHIINTEIADPSPDQPATAPRRDQIQECPNPIVVRPRVLVLTVDSRTTHLEVMCPKQDGDRFTVSQDTKILITMQVKTRSQNNPSGTIGDFTTFAHLDGTWSSNAVVRDPEVLTQLKGVVSGTYYTGGLLYRNPHAGCDHNEFEFRCIYVLSPSKGGDRVLRCQTSGKVQATSISNEPIFSEVTPRRASYRHDDRVQMTCTVTSVPALGGKPLKTWIWGRMSQHDNTTWFPVHAAFIKGPLNSCNFMVSTTTLNFKVRPDVCRGPTRCYLADLDLTETGFAEKVYKVGEFPPLLCAASFRTEASTNAGHSPVTLMPRPLLFLTVLVSAML